MKSVLISVKPKFCELIASGKKTVELRKTRPKLEVPFKVYMYCTKDKIQGTHGKYLHTSDKVGVLHGWNNPNDCDITVQPDNYTYKAYSCRGKVIGEFVCDYIVDWDMTGESSSRVLHSFVIDGCLSPLEICEYAYKGRKMLRGWHISDLVTYDKPKELSEFVPSCYRLIGDMENTCDGICDCEYQRIDRNPDGKINTFICTNRVQHPPQSWCYVEGEEVRGDGI